MSNRPIALGLVGCGRLAEAGYLPAIAATDAVRLVAVADTDASRRALVADLAGVPAFAGAGALAAEELDALVVATPATAHVTDAALAAASGLPVLVEKPPAPDAERARELAQLDPAPWVAFNRRFDPGLQAMRAAVPPRGELQLLIEITYRRHAWGAVAVRDDALLDLGPHVVDLARWLTGSDVLAAARATVEPERAVFELTLDRAHARVRVATNRPHRERVEVRDGRGRVVARHRRGGVVAAARAQLERSPGPTALVASLAGQLAAFAEAVRGASSPTLGTAADGVAVMDVIDAVRISAASGGRAAAVALRVTA